MQGCDDSQQELFCTVDRNLYSQRPPAQKDRVDLDFLYDRPLFCSDNGRPSIDGHLELTH